MAFTFKAGARLTICNLNALFDAEHIEETTLQLRKIIW